MLQVHQRLGDFEIIRLLGKGGMGEVYEAQQANPSRRVALKVLAPWLAQDDNALERFWREAEVPARLDHPNIVRIISTDKTDDGIAFYTMHLVRGISLADLIKRGRAPEQPPASAHATVAELPARHETPSASGPLPPSEFVVPATEGESPPIVADYLANRFQVTARLGAVAARALASAHKQGVLHRDIKPSNMMVDHHGHLHIVDFGLTRALLADADHSIPGQIRGTPWYMSPEQARGDVIDSRSDIYSLGVTLYELISRGTGPYTASRQNSEAVIKQVKQGEYLPLRVVAPDVPPELERIVQKAMQFSPKRRHANAEEMARELEACANEPPSNRNLLSTRMRRRLPRFGWRRVAVVLFAVVICALAAALLLVQKPKEPVPFCFANADPDYPQELRERRWNHAISLVHTDGSPLWVHRLFGEGKVQAARKAGQIGIVSMPGKDRTLLALDDDPKRRWFEFATEFSADAPGSHAGLFFGWRQAQRDLKGSVDFISIELSNRPSEIGPDGEIRVGLAHLSFGDNVRFTIAEWSRSFPDGTMALPAKANPGYWPRLTVRAVNNVLSVAVKGAPRTMTFDLSSLKKTPDVPQNVDVRGALGIWVENGIAFFKNPTISALPGDETGQESSSDK